MSGSRFTFGPLVDLDAWTATLAPGADAWDCLAVCDHHAAVGLARPEAGVRFELVEAKPVALKIELAVEVDRLLAQFDPILETVAGQPWSSAQRASFLAHATNAVVEPYRPATS